jgi:hypothetical protein
MELTFFVIGRNGQSLEGKFEFLLKLEAFELIGLDLACYLKLNELFLGGL